MIGGKRRELHININLRKQEYNKIVKHKKIDTVMFQNLRGIRLRLLFVKNYFMPAPVYKIIIHGKSIIDAAVSAIAGYIN